MLQKDKVQRLLGTIVAAFLVILPGNVLGDIFPATPISGTLDYTTPDGAGGLKAGDKWAVSDATEVWYKASREGDHFLFQYQITVPENAVSHFILETSPNASLFNFHAWQVNGTAATEITSSGILSGVTTYGPQNSNPGLDNDIVGVKFDINDQSVDPLVLKFQFESYHVPMWGDIYAKSGKDNYLYNVGQPTNLGSNLQYDYDGTVDEGSLASRYVLVPDTQQVPLPGAMILGSLGLGAAGYGLKRKKKTA